MATSMIKNPNGVVQFESVILSNGTEASVRKNGRICEFSYTNNQSSAVSNLTGHISSDFMPGHIVNLSYSNSSLYINAAGDLVISANAWAGVQATYIHG